MFHAALFDHYKTLMRCLKSDRTVAPKTALERFNCAGCQLSDRRREEWYFYPSNKCRKKLVFSLAGSRTLFLPYVQSHLHVINSGATCYTANITLSLKCPSLAAEREAQAVERTRMFLLFCRNGIHYLGADKQNPTLLSTQSYRGCKTKYQISALLLHFSPDPQEASQCWTI